MENLFDVAPGTMHTGAWAALDLQGTYYLNSGRLLQDCDTLSGRSQHLAPIPELRAWVAGPIGAVRVAKTGGRKWVVGPSLNQQKSAALSLLYAGTENACTLLEVQVGMSQEAFHHVQTCRMPSLGAWSAGVSIFLDA